MTIECCNLIWLQCEPIWTCWHRPGNSDQCSSGVKETEAKSRQEDIIDFPTTFHQSFPPAARFLPALVPCSGGCDDDRRQKLRTFTFAVRWRSSQYHGCQGCQQIRSDWPRNGTNPGLFKISFSFQYILALASQNILKRIFKKSRICPILGPIWPDFVATLTSLLNKPSFYTICR